jgi:hypothetical protein
MVMHRGANRRGGAARRVGFRGVGGRAGIATDVSMNTLVCGAILDL